MKILFTFPGQGTQHAGMLQQLPADKTLYEEIHSVLGEAWRELDSAQALQHTRAVQLCLLIAGVAWGRELIAHGVKPDMVCGLSIGAFPAAVIAGALNFTDALRLVALRGDLMEQAYPHGYGLTAITGLTQQEVETLIADSGTFIANLNAERQIVIAGSDEAMARVAEQARVRGAHRVQRLTISVPSHCALLNEPAKKLADALAGISLSAPQCIYLSGNSGRALWQPGHLRDDLAWNMARTVRWHEAMIAAEERDVRLTIEMPPGNVLTTLTQQAISQGEAISLERGGSVLAVRLAQRLKKTS